MPSFKLSVLTCACVLRGEISAKQTKRRRKAPWSLGVPKMELTPHSQVKLLPNPAATPTFMCLLRASTRMCGFYTTFKINKSSLYSHKPLRIFKGGIKMMTYV